MSSGLLSSRAVIYPWPIREEPADDRSRLKTIPTSILAHIGPRHLQQSFLFSEVEEIYSSPSVGVARYLYMSLRIE